MIRTHLGEARIGLRDRICPLPGTTVTREPAPDHAGEGNGMRRSSIR
jgi:hypothetical protein